MSNSNEPRTLAVVVAFNRIALLRECLLQLQNQTRPLTGVLVVDNGSTDGTRGMVESEFPQVTLLPLDANIGGAGGFAVGVDYAVEHAFDWAWLMDDDAAPEPAALAELMAVAGDRPEVPFIAPLVVDDVSGRPLYGHDRRKISERHAAVEEVDAASFVGPLINLDVAAREHLPVTDFFILQDDLEYTSRISRRSPGVLAEAARVRHPSKPEQKDLGWRTYPAIRNPLWLAFDRRLSSDQIRRQALVEACKTTVRQALHSKDKRAYIRHSVRAAKDGIFRRPQLYSPGTLPERYVPKFHNGPR